METGLFFSVPSPVNVTSLPVRDAMGVNILIPRPASPQLRTPPSELRPPRIITASEYLIIEAPRASAIPIALSESSQNEGFRSILSPCARSAAATARCISLFEAGAFTVPEISDG